MLNAAKTLFTASALTLGLSTAAHAGAWSEVFIPSTASTQHASAAVCKRGGFDPYSEGMRIGPRDAYSDGGNRQGPRDAFTDGARSIGQQGACASRAA
ncbi:MULTISPECIES: hypothetical protein [unclassified Cupriavidus]|uniref:hypothetical protein n=1 Tax=unclassified Cupriavidus TaxID=2640874 RepID=UPI0010F6587F|nr:MULTISPECIES: hypothetical protein [unclassified Cupriavidus]MWL89241.1 hypothetical protein [Cupriavidus sp. SW-Y-13]